MSLSASAVVAASILTFCSSEMEADPASASPPVHVIVEDSKGEPVPGLSEAQFQVKCGDTPCVSRMSPLADEPITVGLLLDTSSSMTRRLFSDSRTLPDAIQAFLNQSHPDNVYFVVEFGDGVKLLQDYTQDSARVLQSLPRSARGLSHRRKSSLALFFYRVSGLVQHSLGRQMTKEILWGSDSRRCS